MRNPVRVLSPLHSARLDLVQSFVKFDFLIESTTSAIAHKGIENDNKISPQCPSEVFHSHRPDTIFVNQGAVLPSFTELRRTTLSSATT